MSEMKTGPTSENVHAFLERVEDQTRRNDSFEILRLMERVTGEPPKMWGPAMIGFGSYHYRYESGREGDWFLTGFSPRKKELSLYIMAGFEEYEELMTRLGRHRTGKSCLYVRTLSDIDLQVLEDLVSESVAHMKRTYPTR